MTKYLMSLSNLEYKMQACEKPALLQKYQNKTLKKMYFKMLLLYHSLCFWKKKIITWCTGPLIFI